MKVLLPLLVLVFASFTQAQPLLCTDLFTSAIDPAYEKIYPLGIDPVSMPNGFMQIGYESEYLFSESGPLLRDYAPAENVMAKDQWLAKTDGERIAWLKERFQNKPEHAASTGLFKIVDTSYMPKELIVDSTGNVEIVLAPFDTYTAWSTAVDEIVARYGVGSQQAMISKPMESAFKPRENAPTEVLVNQALGWLIYTNLRDMFAKFQSGAARYQKDPTKLSAQFMDHPFLGPMTKLKRDIMEKYLKANAKGEMYDPASKQFVRKRDLSFKYTGGPSYRPDIASPERFSWEIRNAHKDVADLKMKVARDFAAHALGLAPYQAFADVPAFDSIAIFERFDNQTQTALKDLFPSKADPRFAYPAEDRLALEAFRNFAIPLQDLDALAKALTNNEGGATELAKKIAKARLTFIASVHETSAKFAKGDLSREQAKADVMGLVCKWAVESGLTEAFNARADAIGHEPKAVKKVEPKELAKAG